MATLKLRCRRRRRRILTKRRRHRRRKSMRHQRGGNDSSNKSHTVKANCSPKPKGEMNSFSCYTDKQLQELKVRWNARHPDAPVKSSDPKTIHEELADKLKDVCNKETCWLKQKSAFGGKLSSDMADSFAPSSPAQWKKNPNEWLSSVDIMKVMRQYEKAYKCFDFIGPSPIDFDKQKLHGECVWEELCHFDVAKWLDQGKTKVGMIFNTDPHDKPGQHWISMFVNLKKGQIFFFDSTGDPPPKEITALVKRIQAQGAAMQPPIHFQYDSSEGVEHQYGDTECGIYSLFFLVHMLEDKLTAHYLKTHILKDEYMQKFRKIYFNEPDLT